MEKPNLYDVQQIYNSILQTFDSTGDSLNSIFDIPGISKFRRLTIAKTIEILLLKYPDVQPYELWKMIEISHMKNYISGSIQIPEVPLSADDFLTYILASNTLTVITSSAQSWKRSSGVAWEEFLQRNLILKEGTTEIKILSAPEMKSLLYGTPLLSESGAAVGLLLSNRDTEYQLFINKVLDDKNFDLFLVYYEPVTKLWKLFGLIQCKTSIRDRLKINMKSSIEAMQHHLWSIVIAMDPAGFISNGGQYNRDTKKSWNGFYVLDNNVSNDESIFYGNLKAIQNLIKQHCHMVLTDMMNHTDSISEDWRP